MTRDENLFYTPAWRNSGPPFLTASNTARSKYKPPTKLLSKPDAIVIGSGIGGLGIASILAQKKGMRVLVLEASAVPGGCTHVHELDGFEFASGLDSVGDMDPRVGRGLFRPTIDLITGGRLQWAKMPDVHEVSTFGDDVYEWFSSPEKNIEWVERMFPGEGDVRAYYELEAKIERSAWSWGLTKLMPEWVPEGVREAVYRTTGGAWREYMGRPTSKVFREELGFSERLSAIFSYMYGNHGATPDVAPFAFHAVNLLHYRDGAYYPVGGPGQIAECIVPIVEAAGGQVAVSSPVKRILIERDKVRGVELESGERVYCELVISDASAYTTYMELIDRDLATRHGYASRFDAVGPSPSHVYLLLGYDEAIDLPKHIVWEMPTYEGISSYDLSKADHAYKGEMRLRGMGGYLLSPSARDPVHAERYPNTSTVVVLAEGVPAWVERARSEPAFHAEFSAGVAENLMRIVHRHMPQLRGKTPKLKRSGIPMGCNPRAWKGCSLGLEPSGPRFVDHTHWLRHRTRIQGLWLSGQDPFSAGFAGSMASARMCYAAMTGNWLFMLP